jgi:hypothetical protein
VVYHDDNVIYNNGEELSEAVDDDMRKSLLIQLYLNMSTCYIRLNNFTLARQVLDDGIKLSEKVSQLYMRRAQVVLSNRGSSIEELREALKEIQMAR